MIAGIERTYTTNSSLFQAISSLVKDGTSMMSVEVSWIRREIKDIISKYRGVDGINLKVPFFSYFLLNDGAK